MEPNQLKFRAISTDKLTLLLFVPTAFIAIFVNNGLVQVSCELLRHVNYLQRLKQNSSQKFYPHSQAQSGYNYPRPDQNLGGGQPGISGTTPVRPPFTPQQPTNDVFQTTIATTPGYPSAGRPSGPAFGPSGSSPGFPGSAPGTLPSIGYDDGFAGARPSLPGATPSTYPGATVPGSSFPTGTGFGNPSAPQGPFSTIAPSSPGSSRPVIPGGRPTGPGFQGNQNAFGGSAPGGFGSAPGSQGGFGSSGGTGGFGSQSGSGGNSGGFQGGQGGQGGNNGQYEGGDYSAIPGEAGIDYPIYTEIPKTSFDCINQQWPGYYADVEAQCQVFHICALNRTYDFLCPNGTIFSQQHLVCVWWNQFDCSSAPSLYGNNAYIYDYSQQGQQRPQTNGQNVPSSQGPVGPSSSFGGNTGPSSSFGGNTGPSSSFGGNNGPSSSFGGNNGPTGPATGFGGNRGQTGPSSSFGGNKLPTGPSSSFGGNTGPSNVPSLIGQPGTGPSAIYPGATAPAVPYPGATAAYPGVQGPSAGGVYPGASQGVFPGSVGPTASYPGSAPSATGYPSATPATFGGYPSADPLFPSPSPPNREYLPPSRI